MPVDVVHEDAEVFEVLFALDHAVASLEGFDGVEEVFFLFVVDEVFSAFAQEVAVDL